ncbi:hypothetical protein D3C81_1742050 [compost metagenome]
MVENTSIERWDLLEMQITIMPIAILLMVHFAMTDHPNLDQTRNSHLFGLQV